MDRCQWLDVQQAAKLLVLLAVLVLGMRAHANTDTLEEYTSLNEIGAGSLVVESNGRYQSFIRSNSQFDVKVSGLVSRVRLTQQFSNPSQEWVEAVYVLPLPENSAVNAMRIVIGERIIEGVIKEKQEAKRIYTQAKAQGKRAGLLQQNGPNMFTTKVANIGPGETVAIEVTFLQVLQLDSGKFEFRLPLTITPRYIPGSPLAEEVKLDVTGWALPTLQVPDANLITPPQTHHLQQDSHRATLAIEIDSGFDVEAFHSPYHQVDVSRLDSRYQINTKQTHVVMNRDFVLNWKPVATQAPVAAYFNETVDSKPHGLLMVVPPVDERLVTIPDRELILVIDTSGSMSGASIHQAKQALALALDQLRPQDHFNVIEFNSGYRQLFAEPQAATPDSIRRARGFVEGLNANGGTNMYGPLQAAMQNASVTHERLKQIVFITDGSVGNEAQLFELIHQQIGSSRLYTVGIGSAPNGYFMRKAAEFGRGTYSYIGKPDEVQEKMAQLFGKIEKPVLTQVRVQVHGAKGELYPKVIPDLFMGEPLLVSAQFDQAPSAITVSGILDGQAWQRELQLQKPTQTTEKNVGQNNGQNEGVATLWARKKVAYYQDEGIRKGQPGLHKQDITQLGINYRLVTPYTSFVAVDVTPVRPEMASLKTKNVPNAMPKGSRQAAPSIGYPKTALGLKWHYMMALLFLVVAVLVWGHNEFTAEKEAQYDIA